jgi:hypothetical protein
MCQVLGSVLRMTKTQTNKQYGIACFNICLEGRAHVKLFYHKTKKEIKQGCEETFRKYFTSIVVTVVMV